MAQGKYAYDSSMAKNSFIVESKGLDNVVKESGQHVKGSQIFIGGLARSVTENMIRELFAQCGEIVEIILKLDHDGNSKGYCFLRFSTKEAAFRAIKEKNGFKLLGKKIRVVIAQEQQDSLFLGGLRKDWTFEEFDHMVRQAFEDVVSVELSKPPYTTDSTERKQNNRGFGFVQFSSHAAAARAHRFASKPLFTLGGTKHPYVDWVESEPDIDPEVLAQVKVAFVGNLPVDVDEDFLRKHFNAFGKIERVALSRKSHFPVGFVHFSERSELDAALAEMDGKMVAAPDGKSSFKIQVSVAKPVDKDRKRQHDEPDSKPTKKMVSREVTSNNNYGADSYDDLKSRAPIYKSLEDSKVDPYEEAILSLLPAVGDCLRRLFRTGVATRDDIDIHTINRLKELPASAALAALDQLILAPERYDKGKQLATLISRCQVDSIRLSQDKAYNGGEVGSLGRTDPEFRSLAGLPSAPGYDTYVSRPTGLAFTTRYDRYALSPPKLQGFPESSALEDSLLSRTSGARRTDAGPYPSYQGSVQHAVYPSGASGREHAPERPRVRFDPFTGEPYKFDPFTGERL